MGSMRHWAASGPAQGFRATFPRRQHLRLWHGGAAVETVGRRATVQVGRWQVHYQVAGEEHEEAVVLVHGFAASYRWWERTIPSLAQRYRVYAVDLPGFGDTLPRRPFAFAPATEMLRGWMDILGLSRATFVGHSMGGHVCIRLAADQPQLVDRLVLVDASGIPLTEPLFRIVIHAVCSGILGSTQSPLRTVANSLRAGPLVLASAAHAVLADDVRQHLDRINAPTLVVWGERDQLVPLPMGVALSLAIPHASLSIIANAGHKVMIERPADFNALLLDFLARSRHAPSAAMGS